MAGACAATLTGQAARPLRQMILGGMIRQGDIVAKIG